MSLLTNVEAELGCDNFPSVAFCLAWPMLKPNTKFALNGPLTETSTHPVTTSGREISGPGYEVSIFPYHETGLLTAEARG